MIEGIEYQGDHRRLPTPMIAPPLPVGNAECQDEVTETNGCDNKAFILDSEETKPAEDSGSKPPPTLFNIVKKIKKQTRFSDEDEVDNGLFENQRTGIYADHDYEKISEESSDTILKEPFQPKNLNNADDNVSLEESLDEAANLKPDENECQNANTQDPKQEVVTPEAWDVFEETFADNFDSSSEQFAVVLLIAFKFLVSSFIALFVLTFAVVSRITLLEMVHHVHFLDLRLVRECGNSSGVTNKSRSTKATWIWALLLTVCAPFFFTFLNSLWKLTFKMTRPIKPKVLFSVLLVESLQSLGMWVLVFVVMPSLDAIHALLILYGVTLFPSLLEVLGLLGNRLTGKKTSVASLLLKTVFFVLLVLLLCAFPLNLQNKNNNNISYTGFVSSILLPVCLALVSLRWWNNYAEVSSIDWLVNSVRDVQRQYTKTNLAVSLWKIILNIVFTYAFFGIGSSDCAEALSRMIEASRCGIHYKVDFGIDKEIQKPFIFAIINIFCGMLCYTFGKTACKILVQRFSFSLPLIATGPVTFVIVVCAVCTEIPFLDFSKDHKDPNRHLKESILCHLKEHWRFLGILFYVTFVVSVTHVWFPNVERLSKTERLFAQPLYCSVLLDQSLMLNRKHDTENNKNEEIPKETQKKLLPNVNDQFNITDRTRMRSPKTPMIYACATMWHETENEMMQLLKSIFRMDFDQWLRCRGQNLFDHRDPDYYEFEGHIFFDDAFEKHNDAEYEYEVNGFVKQLVKLIDEAASAVHKRLIMNGPPTKIPTPYGGRLEWLLPGENKLVAHLKDKEKIRHKKRWSQVMYMYYFLGQQIMAEDMPDRKRTKLADNTFLLALDGDVDFQPSAVILLVDRMKKNRKVGAACGRIHPIGSGPMVWYQKFEYAISHWLQKSTEHVIGCVLCSPGCFSLFRGSALMANNVMKRYTTTSNEARHYVQYDQGEDRWLCTLMLQEGFRVEYCAASDALTYCPEGFNEFYNQRRRWTPSTMANILDLLADWKHVRQSNDSISFLYIVYQGALMLSSILTPGTIFLLVMGALNTAYPDVSLQNSFVINLTPVTIFLLMCFFVRSDVQLMFAAILSVVYALVMMLVLVGLLVEFNRYLYCSTTSAFFIFVAGSFLLSAILHPQEFICIIYGLLYFLAVPSMSMLLMIYALGNLHVVSWGTREGQKATVQRSVESSKPLTRVEKIQSFFGFGNQTDNNMDSDYTFSLGNVFRCMCCPRSTVRPEDRKYQVILERLGDIEDKLLEVNKGSQSGNTSSLLGDDVASVSKNSQEHGNAFSSIPELFEGAVTRDNPVWLEEKQKIRDELTNPFWINDKDLRNGPVKFLSSSETDFWKKLINKYLYPMAKDEQLAKREKEVVSELKLLRNKTCLGFFLLNALFVVVVFTLEYMNSLSSTLSIQLPCDLDKKGQNINPISLVFISTFGVVLLIQDVAMIFHRLATFLHIMASTDMKNLGNKKADLSWNNILSLTKDMVACQGDDDDSASVSSVSTTISSTGDVASETLRGRKNRYIRKLIRRRKNSISVTPNLNKILETSFLKVMNVLEVKDNESGNGCAELNLPKNKFKEASLVVLQNIANDKEMRESMMKRRQHIEKKWKNAFDIIRKAPTFATIAEEALKKKSILLQNGKIKELQKVPSSTSSGADHQVDVHQIEENAETAADFGATINDEASDDHEIDLFPKSSPVDAEGGSPIAGVDDNQILSGVSKAKTSAEAEKPTLFRSENEMALSNVSSDQAHIDENEQEHQEVTAF